MKTINIYHHNLWKHIYKCYLLCIWIYELGHAYVIGLTTFDVFGKHGVFLKKIFYFTLFYSAEKILLYDFHDFFCLRATRRGHCTRDTFLSCIHCRFSCAMLFPASRLTFLCLSGITARQKSFVDVPIGTRFASSRGLISINCSVTPLSTISVLQDGSSTRKTRRIRATIFSGDSTMFVFYMAEITGLT